jgi:hypothetical protein
MVMHPHKEKKSNKGDNYNTKLTVPKYPNKGDN